MWKRSFLAITITTNTMIDIPVDQVLIRFRLGFAGSGNCQVAW